MAPLPLLLLPGLDGTGRLFGPFLRVLPDRFAPVVISYPADTPMSYNDTVAFVRRQIAPGVQYIVLGESYSGPVALGLAAGYPSAVRAVILCSTFISPPYPLLLPWLSRLLPSSFVLHHMPQAAIRYFMCGEDAPDTFVNFLHETICTVSNAVLGRRVNNIMHLKDRPALARCRAPLMYLHGARDHLVSTAKEREITQARPDTTVVSLPGPHMLLQRLPAESLAAIEQFLSDSGIE